MRIEKAVAKIKSLGMDALGVSDHGTMAAHYKFNEICKREGIHPIFATEGYLTWDKSFKKEDFEKVNIETDKEGKHIFAFMQKEEAAGSWMPVSYFPTKKRQQEIERLAKSDYYPRLYEESFADPGMIPQKKTAYNKGMNALVKSYKDKGYELCIKADTSQRDFFEWFPWSGHLLLIAKNNEGYQNLLRLNNIANLEGFYGKPRFDYEDIKKYGKGIIATSSCMGGIAPQLILKGKLKEAKEELEKYREAFDEVYLELQPSRNPDQWVINNQLIEWSEELQMPLIATTDAHMVDKDEMELHETLTNIGRGSNNYTEDESDISAYDSAYLMSQEEILENGIPRIALQNAYDLSHRCKVTFLDDIEVKYPEYDVPAGYTFDSYLEELAWNGLFDIFLKKDYIENYNLYQERLKYELKVIKDKHLSAYFIIVWDYVKWAKEQGIYVAPGRGSGAGSLVTYVLSITNLDPIKYGLLFERFLNPERNSLPDIDSDFSSHRRHEVIDYLIDKYGQDHVASIGTYQTMTSKAILRDVAKVMGVDHRLALDWNKNIPAPNGNVMPIGQAIEEIPVIAEASKQYPQLFELANDLQSMPKSKGIHACFDEDALVSTEQGLKRIVDIKVGDKVFTHKQRFKEVVKLMEYDTEEVFHLRASSMHPVRVTGNHPVYARRRYFKRDRTDGKDIKHKLFYDPRWVRVDDLTKEDYLGVPINLNSIIPSFEEYSLPFEQPEFWWLIGRYLGDGWTEHYDRLKKTGLKYSEYRVIICCTSKHDDELEEITSKLESLNVSYRVEQRGSIYKIHMSNPRNIYDYLQRFGRYADGKKLAQEVFDLPKDLVQSLLEGYFSADGHFIEKSQRKVVTTVSKELAVGVMQLIHKAYERPTSIGINPAKEGVIGGRAVQHKKKYRVSYTLKQSKYQRSFYEDGYIWTKVSQLEKEKVNQKVYNLTVLDDSTYTVNNIAVHNSGYQVAPDSLYSNLPLWKNKDDEIITQYEGTTLENLGYIKFDILSTKVLSIIEITVDLVEERHGIKLDINEIEPEDEAAFKTIQDGNTYAIFQLSSPGMTNIFTQLNEVDFNSLIAGVALYRPGPMEHIPDYIARANGVREVTYSIPELKEILEPTFGIAIYQESIMQITQRLGGYSAGQADAFRKSIGKKSQKVMDEELPKLREAIVNHGYSEDVAREVQAIIEPFVGYGLIVTFIKCYCIKNIIW